MKNLIITILIITTGILSGCSLPQKNTQTPPTIPENITKKYGIIEGSLSYPSEGLPPDIQACAENITTKEVICTTEQLKDKKYTYGIGYKLKVPVGEYYVRLETAGHPEFKGLYSEFVLCGLRIECPSHKLIPVTVNADQTIENINPEDWYSPL